MKLTGIINITINVLCYKATMVCTTIMNTILSIQGKEAFCSANLMHNDCVVCFLNVVSGTVNADGTIVTR